PPPPGSGEQSGCLPFWVFMLGVAVAGGLVVLRTGWLLPTDQAGRAVVEIMGSPTRDQMKAHEKRITSGEILKRAFKNLNLPNGAGKEVEAKASGPFITITVRTDNDVREAVSIAGVVANAYDEDLQSQR